MLAVSEARAPERVAVEIVDAHDFFRGQGRVCIVAGGIIGSDHDIRIIVRRNRALTGIRGRLGIAVVWGGGRVVVGDEALAGLGAGVEEAEVCVEDEKGDDGGEKDGDGEAAR